MSLDANGYPTPEALERLRTYDVLQEPVEGLLELIKDSVWHADRQFCEDETKFELHTGGWSGNEAVIAALRGNFLFWSQFWVSTHRGGHYYFEIPERWR